MALTKIGSIGINTGIAFAGVTTITTLNSSDVVLSVGGTVNFVSDISIGGTVSIGGTLTYEDVTNIDSVGIITARSGVKVNTLGVDIAAGGLKVIGVSTFGNSDITIDGSAVTEEWNGGSAPTAGGAGGYDVYNHNIIKTADATYVVLSNLINYA